MVIFIFKHGVVFVVNDMHWIEVLLPDYLSLQHSSYKFVSDFVNFLEFCVFIRLKVDHSHFFFVSVTVESSEIPHL